MPEYKTCGYQHVSAEKYDFIRQQEADQARLEKLNGEITSATNLSAETIETAYRKYYKGLEIRNYLLSQAIEISKKLSTSEESRILIENYKIELEYLKIELEYLKKIPIKFEKPNLEMSGRNCYEINNEGIGSLVRVPAISQIQSSLLSELNLSEVSDGVKVYKDFKKTHKEMATVLTKMVEAEELGRKLELKEHLKEGYLSPDSIKSSAVKLYFKEKLRFYGVLPVKYAFKNKKNKTALVVAVVFGIAMYVDAVLSGVDNMTNFKPVKSFKDLFSNHLGMVAFWALALLTLGCVFKVIATGRSGMVFNENYVRVNPEAGGVNPGINDGNHYAPYIGDAEPDGYYGSMPY